MRVKPVPAMAWAIGIGYAILFLVLEKIIGVGYDKIGTTTDSIVKGIVVPVAVGSLVLIVVTTLARLVASGPARAARRPRAAAALAAGRAHPRLHRRPCSASTTATSATWAPR